MPSISNICESPQGSSQPMNNRQGKLDEVIHEILAESLENLDQLDQDLVELEQRPTDKDLLSNIFRTLHTIKGACGFLGNARLESLTHGGENLLSKLRDGNLTLTVDSASVLLSTADAIRQILSHIESDRDENGMNHSALMARLDRLTYGDVALGPDEPPAATPLTADPKMADASIRVDVKLLGKLMGLVGELSQTRNQIMQQTSKTKNKDPDYVATSQRLDLLTTELQESVMAMHMQPIGNIWNKFPRIVRDLSLSCGKKVRIEIAGEETALDKTIIEAVKNLLMHIVRNSVDHGIETPQTRLANGKPAEGLLLLRAFHEEGQVIIEVKDDGKGIDGERIKKKALERGAITQEQAACMSDRESVNLIFAPGFSTVAKITSVSGRGVGMDIVKTGIEKIGGTVDVQSKVNEGTCLKLTIPRLLWPSCLH